MKSQTEKIIEYMQKHGEITQRDAIWLGVYRLASRICELRHSFEHTSWEIHTEMREVTNSDGSKSRIAVYSMKERSDND